MEDNTEHNRQPKKQKCLTISELRNCKGLGNLSDEDAVNVISTLEKFSFLMYELYKKDKALKEKINKSKKTE